MPSKTFVKILMPKNIKYKLSLPRYSIVDLTYKIILVSLKLDIEELKTITGFRLACSHPLVA